MKAWLSILSLMIGGAGAHAQTTFIVPQFGKPISPSQPVTCGMKKLMYKGNGVPEVPAHGTNVIWGGSATYSGNPAPLQELFLKRARAAKVRGLTTMMYLEGPCGQTGGSDPDNEIGKCRSKFQLHNARHRDQSRGIPDTTQARWKPYTIAQLKLSVAEKIDLCEIDNMNNSDGLIPFLRTYKQLFDRGEIYCRLVLKNLNPVQLTALKYAFGTGPAVDFISHLHIKEVGGNGCNSGRGDFSRTQAAVNEAFRELKGPAGQTVLSRDTCQYESANFSDESVNACPGGRTAPSQTDVLVGQGDASR